MPHYERNIRLILFLILPILGFLLGWSLSQKTTDNHKENPITVNIETPTSVKEQLLDELKPQIKLIKRNNKAKDVDLSIFWETWNLLEENFLHQDRFKVQKQIYGAAQGLVNSLEDPYTVFMTPEETKKFEESISGEFEGVGAEIGMKKGQLVIISPIKGAPAELAGLKSGDAIFKIDGEQTHGLSIEEAVTRIRGPKGEKVVLTILREGEKNPLDITIVRDNIVVKSLEWKMEGDIAVLTVSQFGTELVREFQGAMAEIVLQKPRGMILDLRNNGGGLLDACVKIASEFLDQQVVVRTKGRKFGDSGDIISSRDGTFLDVPLIVLVNQGSASASEIFSGAIQDHKRGVLLGQKTFGKGSVQNVIPLSDGSSLKVTIAEWLTPSGRSIQEKGIDPDEVIERSEDDFDSNNDPVMERALKLIGTDEMKERLSSEAEKEATPEEEHPISTEESGEAQE
ncbi:S41 family peptidase [Candidatus Gracilibacteria bacterium]|nr:S41 family peptidase [Candidatus Gracilibacteria bacterium]